MDFKALFIVIFLPFVFTEHDNENDCSHPHHISHSFGEIRYQPVSLRSSKDLSSNSLNCSWIFESNKDTNKFFVVRVSEISYYQNNDDLLEFSGGKIYNEKEDSTSTCFIFLQSRTPSDEPIPNFTFDGCANVTVTAIKKDQPFRISLTTRRTYNNGRRKWYYTRFRMSYFTHSCSKVHENWDSPVDSERLCDMSHPLALAIIATLASLLLLAFIGLLIIFFKFRRYRNLKITAKQKPMKQRPISAVSADDTYQEISTLNVRGSQYEPIRSTSESVMVENDLYELFKKEDVSDATSSSHSS